MAFKRLAAARDRKTLKGDGQVQPPLLWHRAGQGASVLSCNKLGAGFQAKTFGPKAGPWAVGLGEVPLIGPLLRRRLAAGSSPSRSKSLPTRPTNLCCCSGT